MRVSLALLQMSLVVVCLAPQVQALDTEAPKLVLLDAGNRPLSEPDAALGISRHITHDRSLQRSSEADAQSDDPENFRVELADPTETADVVYARLESWGTPNQSDGVLRHVPLRRVPGSARFRSPFVRLVADSTDATAPDVGDQILRARLRGRVRAVVRRGGRELAVELPVGAPGSAAGPRAALRGTLRLTVLR